MIKSIVVPMDLLLRGVLAVGLLYILFELGAAIRSGSFSSWEPSILIGAFMVYLFLVWPFAVWFRWHNKLTIARWIWLTVCAATVIPLIWSVSMYPGGLSGTSPGLTLLSIVMLLGVLPGTVLGLLLWLTDVFVPAKTERKNTGENPR